MIKKGQLVKPCQTSAAFKKALYHDDLGIGLTEMDSVALVVRGPYEGTDVTFVCGMKTMSISHCVDILMPNGEVLCGIKCRNLEKA